MHTCAENRSLAVRKRYRCSLISSALELAAQSSTRRVRCATHALHFPNGLEKWQVVFDDDLYDDLDEDQYQDLVRKRRDDNFIEDDGAAKIDLA